MSIGTQGIVLYDNVGDGATPSYTGTEIDGQGKENAADWQEYTLFSVETGSTTLTWTLAAAATIDAIAVYHADRGDTSGTVTIDVYTGSWYNVATVTLDDLGNMRLETFTSVSSVTQIRFVFAITDGPLLIRQLMAGEALQMYKGQFQGVRPGTLPGGAIRTNVISSTGAIIGSNVRRTVRTMEISLSLLSEDWVRTQWTAFAEHAERKPFAYLWDPDVQTRDAVWAAASEIVPPEYGSPSPSMTARMPLVVRS